MLDSIFFGFKITSLLCYEFIARCFGRKRLDSIKNICLVLSDRNVMYTKILQSISCAGNFLTSEEMDYLSIYNDKAPYKKNEEYNIAELVEHLNKGRTDKIIMDSYEPVKAGMVALVYYGNLNDKDIIIKVKRKHIFERLMNALDVAEIICYVSQFMPYLNILQLSTIFKENKIDMCNQIDFYKEILNGKRFYNFCRNIDYVIIPYIYDEYTNINENVIVMERLYGKTLVQLNDNERYKYSINLMKYVIKSILYDGFYHADLHMGNIFFMEDNNIGLIDFGLVGLIDREKQNRFYLFFKHCFINQNTYAAAKVVIEKLAYPEENLVNLSDSEKNELLKLISNQIYFLFRSSKTLDLDIILKINNILRRYNLILSPFFCKIQMTLAVMNSVAMELSRNTVPIMQSIELVLKEMIGENDADLF